MGRVLVVVVLTLVAAACGSGDDADRPEVSSTGVRGQTTTPIEQTTAPESPTTAPTIITTLPPSTSSITAPVAERFVWPGEGPERYAVVYDDRVEVVDPDGTTILDIAGIRSGAMVGDEFVFALQGYFGTWVWPPRPGLEGAQPAGDEKVSMLIGHAGTEIHTWFHDVAVIEGRPTVIYSEIETEAEGQPERVMLYDLESGATRQLFDRASRRLGLSGEEQDAWIASVSSGGDRFVALLGFGDSTWLEWYDTDGQPLDEPFDQSAFAGEVAEVVLSPNGETIAVTIETELHQPIRELLVMAMTGDEVGRWTIEDPSESLYGLSNDGRFVTAGLMDDGDNRGMFIVDLFNNQAELLSIPARIASERT